MRERERESLSLLMWREKIRNNISSSDLEYLVMWEDLSLSPMYAIIELIQLFYYSAWMLEQRAW